MPLGGWKGTQTDLFTCHRRADVAGADRAALTAAQKHSSEQGEGCCLPSSAPGEQGIREPLHTRARSEAAFPQSGSVPWRDRGRRGDATLMGAQEQKASEPLREERTNFSWVRGKGVSMGK